MTVVSSSTPPPALSGRDRLLLICAVSLFVIAATIFGSLYWLTRPAKPGRAHMAARWTNPASQAELDATLERAKWLRERFAVWARAHRKELLALRRAAPDDETAMQRVYNALPTYPNAAENGFDGTILNEDGKMFCWNVDTHLLSQTDKDRNDPLVQEHLTRGHNVLETLRHHNYATQHDVALGFSITRGPIRYTLWADGRLTETRLSLEARGDPMLAATEKELLPPYDFIR